MQQGALIKEMIYKNLLFEKVKKKMGYAHSYLFTKKQNVHTLITGKDTIALRILKKSSNDAPGRSAPALQPPKTKPGKVEPQKDSKVMKLTQFFNPINQKQPTATQTQNLKNDTKTLSGQEKNNPQGQLKQARVSGFFNHPAAT